MDQDDTIVEGTVLEESTDEAPTGVSSAENEGTEEAASFLSLEELIKNQIDSIAKLKEELKAQKEMFDDSFNNSPAYHENTEKVKDATKAKLSVKKQISTQPSVAILAEKVKDLRFDINEKNQTLSDLLKDYHEKTKATQIETNDGKVMEIVSTLKLVKAGGKFNP